MRGTAEPYLRWDVPDPAADRAAVTNDDLAVGIAHLVAQIVMDVAGPVFWGGLALWLAGDLLRSGLPH
jgi:hypothetical protein